MKEELIRKRIAQSEQHSTIVQNTVNVFCDGSCNNKTGEKGGYGIVMRYKGIQKEYVGGSYSQTTSARMEILAAIVALETVKPQFRIKIHSDSQYVINTVVKGWLFNWAANDFLGRSNADLWRRFLKAYNKFPKGYITMIWIRGHNGHMFNELADCLAREGANNNEIIIDNNNF